MRKTQDTYLYSLLLLDLVALWLQQMVRSTLNDSEPFHEKRGYAPASEDSSQNSFLHSLIPLKPKVGNEGMVYILRTGYAKNSPPRLKQVEANPRAPFSANPARQELRNKQLPFTHTHTLVVPGI